MLEESYKITDDFELKRYWTLSVKNFKERKNKKKYYPVEIKVPQTFGKIFENYDLIGIRKEGDSIIGMIDLHKKDVAENEIRAFLCYGEILFPEEMKSKAKEILESSLQIYKG